MYDNLNQVISGFQKKAKQIGDGNARIFRAMKEPNNPPFPKLDNIIQEMPGSEKKTFSARFTEIIPASAQSFEREYVDHFLEACVEVLGWGWLKDRYPLYMPCLTMGTPDLLVKDNSEHVIAAMECKKIRTSDEDRDYYQNKQGTAQKIKDSLTSSDIIQNPFLRKLQDTLGKAEQQVNHSDATDKFIFLDLSFDTPLMFSILKEPVICSISHLARELYKKRIRLVSFEQYNVEEPITGA